MPLFQRSEEHTSELQSRGHLVCRLLLEHLTHHLQQHSFPTRRSSDLGETNEPNIIDNKELRLFLERQQTIFNIPGNLPEIDSVKELAAFMYDNSGSTDLVLEYALVPGVGFHGLLTREIEDGLNFDWVTYPPWGGEYSDFIPNSLYHNIFVTSQSENPDAAFEVIEYLLSDEYQKESVSQGRLTPLISEEVDRKSVV